MKDKDKFKVAADLLSANTENSFENDDISMHDTELDMNALQEMALTSAMVDKLAEIYQSDNTTAVNSGLPQSLRAEIDKYSSSKASSATVTLLRTPARANRVRNYFAIAASVLLFAVAAPSLLQLTTPNVYIGNTPMPRSIQLDDGSTVLLNTNSKIKVDYTDDQREVNLIQGHAYFTVTKNKDRPFVVNTRESSFRAVGTEFDVEYQQEGVKLIVTEGAVQLVSDFALETQNPHGQKILSANESAYVFGDNVSIDRLTPIEVEQSTAWQNGFVFFDDAPLAEIVAEMNNHISGKIIILDSEIGKFRSGGVYQIGQESAMIEAIKETLPIKASNLTSYVTLLQMDAH